MLLFAYSEFKLNTPVNDRRVIRKDIDGSSDFTEMLELKGVSTILIHRFLEKNA